MVREHIETSEMTKFQNRSETQSVLLLGLHPHDHAILGTAAQPIQVQLAVGRCLASNELCSQAQERMYNNHSYYQSTTKLLNSSKPFTLHLDPILTTIPLYGINWAQCHSIHKNPVSSKYFTRGNIAHIKSCLIVQRC